MLQKVSNDRVVADRYSLSSGDFLRDVFELGDERKIVTSREVYTSNNVKILSRGTRINSSLLNKVLRHKLLPPIEQCLMVEDGVDRAALISDVRQLMLNDERFKGMETCFSIDDVAQVLELTPLPAALAFKLTLARDRRPKLYAHSLDVSLLAVVLMSFESNVQSGLVAASAAGLYHDLGILHIPSEVLSPGKELTEANRHFLYAHPILGEYVAREYPELDPSVSNAILEHHERVDGSGYPIGLLGGAISNLGKILMVADTCAGLLSNKTREQASIAFRLMRRKFEKSIFDCANRLLFGRGDTSIAASSQDLNFSLRRLGVIAEVMNAWSAIRVALVKDSDRQLHGPLVSLIEDRISALERALLESGFAANQLDYFAATAVTDSDAQVETVAIANEALWQLKDIVNELQRRWTEDAPIESEILSVAEWLSVAEEKLALAH